MTLYVDLAAGTRNGRCAVSKDGAVCLEHERAWPCPVGELRVQITSALISQPPDDETQQHLERALELAWLVR